MKNDKLKFDEETVAIRRDVIKITGLPLLVGKDNEGIILIVTNPKLDVPGRVALRLYVKVLSNPMIKLGLNFVNPDIIRIEDKKKRIRNIMKLKIV